VANHGRRSRGEEDPERRHPSITLRRLLEPDEEAFFEAARDSRTELGRWLPGYGEGFSREDARRQVRMMVESWERGERYTFAVAPEDGSQREIWGICALNHLNRVHRFANLMYWVRSTQAGRGVATVAVRRTAAFAFTRLGLYRVEIIVDPRNLASQRVATRCGARREALARNRIFYSEGPADAIVYSLVPEDLGLEPPAPATLPADFSQIESI
jgi:RimJ/RimL family protein N-acetyltransferase